MRVCVREVSMRATFDDQLAKLAAAGAQYIVSYCTRIEGILKFIANEIDDEPRCRGE